MTRPAGVATRTVVAGALGFVFGIALVVWNAGGERRDVPETTTQPRARDAATSVAAMQTAPETPLAAPAGGVAATAAPATVAPRAGPTPGFVVLDGDAGLASPLAAADETTTGTEPLVDASVPTATPFTGPRRVERGRVAYLRCDGVPQRPGPYPCPRDEALETAVWAVLETLPRCAEAPQGLGESDVRLELAAGRATVARLRAPRPDVPRLDGAAVLRCVAGPLSHLTTSSGATRLMLAFRFSLVDAAAPRSDARRPDAP